VPSRSRENQDPLTASLEQECIFGPRMLHVHFSRPSLSQRPTVSHGESHAHSPFETHAYHERQRRSRNRCRPTRSRSREQHPLAFPSVLESREAHGHSECQRRKTKDARDEVHARLYPRPYNSSSLTGTATLVSPPAFRRLLAENMAPLAGSAGAKLRNPRGWSAMSR
jgi:hypothetical protein